MNILLHTIALEPARWTPQRVSRPLAELLPFIAGAGFYKLEIFEPHLALLHDEGAMPALFAQNHLVPLVFSSYLDLTPHANSDEAFAAQSRALLERVDRFGCKKVRLFPGRSPAPEAVPETIERIAVRLGGLASQRPEVEFLLETHDGSVADDPAGVVEVLQRTGLTNVGLLWQPTIFEPGAALAQWKVQKPHVRHFHLQNRTPDGKFARLATGVVPWNVILADAEFKIDASIEFVPTGICEPGKFDLTTTVQEAVEEFHYIVKLENRTAA